MRGGTSLAPWPKSFKLSSLPPTLIERDEPVVAEAPRRRTKLWEFNGNLHCSIIGTCLSTGELRQVLRKLGLASLDSTDHELHRVAVSLAGRHEKPAKLLNKALDERHRIAINQFGKAADEDTVLATWRDAVKRGDIPGAYWAALTHPATTQAVIQDAFGEVHMLSHLVGAANRADIRRLSQLQADNADLEERLQRHQVAFRDAVVTRDTRIQELEQALTMAAISQPTGTRDGTAALRQAMTELEQRLAGETQRRQTLSERLDAVIRITEKERAARAEAEAVSAALQRELDAVELSLKDAAGASSTVSAKPTQLDGITLLYVGGHPHQVIHLRAAAERAGATFLHHDGGVEHHLNLLPGLTSRADMVAFPVTCISHQAAQLAKQLCHQTGKAFLPLRSTDIASLVAALRQQEVAGLAGAAD